MTNKYRFEAIKKNGAARGEIMETIAVAKFAKSATALSPSAQALELLAAKAEH
jgi:hypothetical protein